MENADIKYLKVLATQYPNIAAAATEIVNLKAILSLPKATEHFITDVHGEYEQFRHVMCNGSGAVQRKIEDEFGSVRFWNSGETYPGDIDLLSGIEDQTD